MEIRMGAINIEVYEHNAQKLKELQALPLDDKIMITQRRILEWYDAFQGKVYVSFSGGKDSTVLLDLARKVCPDIPAVFVDTGLEYPEIRSFAMQQENVHLVFPQYGKAGKRNDKKYTDRFLFSDVLRIYGYPVISKEVSHHIEEARSSFNRGTLNFAAMSLIGTGVKQRGPFDRSKWFPIADLPFRISDNCCLAMKKRPAKRYARLSGRYPITGQTAAESRLRRQHWIRHGCNGFDMKSPISNPMAFWQEQDVLEYIVRYKIPICNLYGIIQKDKGKNTRHCTGCQRTGCIFCAYGLQCERGRTRFQRLSETHPHQYQYCIGGGQWIDNPRYDPFLTGKYIWNPKQIWIPSKHGLGLGKVFDMCNEAMGKEMFRYR